MKDIALLKKVVLIWLAFALAACSLEKRKPYRIPLHELPPNQGMLLVLPQSLNGNVLPADNPLTPRYDITGEFRKASGEISTFLGANFNANVKFMGKFDANLSATRQAEHTFADFSYDHRRVRNLLRQNGRTYLLYPVYRISMPRTAVPISGNTNCPNQFAPVINFWYFVFGPTGELLASTDEFLIQGMRSPTDTQIPGVIKLYDVKATGDMAFISRCWTIPKANPNFRVLFMDFRIRFLKELRK